MKSLLTAPRRKPNNAMNKLVVVLFVLLTSTVSAQTVFYYGKDSVSAKEFLRAYQKNNTGPKTDKAFRDYLDLFIVSRLKIREAKDRGYDTLPQMIADLDNLRQQILPGYLNDKEAIDKLVAQALLRGEKDIHLAHIFISSSQDGAVIKAKLDSVEAGLRANKSFTSLAKQYSDDPGASGNGGDLGWITVFSLPYELENLAYNTVSGKVSSPYNSKAGIHIFKNLGERKDLGRIKASQILLAFPPGATADDKVRVKKLADSLYTRLIKGDDFGKLAAEFSNDIVSAAANGQLQEFGTGQYDAVFEDAAFALQTNGAVSKPVLSSYGYHIIKRTSRSTFAGIRLDPKQMQLFRDKVEQGDRSKVAKEGLANKVLAATGYNLLPVVGNKDFTQYSDSLLNFTPIGRPLPVNANTVVLKLKNENYTMGDWINYAQTFRYKQDGSGVKTYQVLWDEFVKAKALSYYESHLEDFNEEFRQQLAEFKEGNLFFEIMQRDIWGPAQNDSLALKKYYEQHAGKYVWNKSADAVIFYATDVKSANLFSAELKKDPADWHRLVNNFGDRVAADSSRFELTQLPNPSRLVLKPGVITSPLINGADNTASLAYVLRMYGQPAQRSFAEAKGLVMNDYQSELEQSWVAELRRKYPVRVNETVVQQLQGGVVRKR